MTDHPRRRRLTPEARAKNTATSMRGIAQGQSKALRPTPGRASLVIDQGNGVMYVFHGDDPTVPRENATLVRWVGAALPDNRFITDDWLNVTLTDDELEGLI